MKGVMQRAALFVPLVFSHSAGLALEPVAAGGSNYAWYDNDDSGLPGTPCFWNYGIIPNYHVSGVRSTVQSQLEAMWNQGQRRLRIPIYHQASPISGYEVDSTYGNLGTQEKQNLMDFMEDIGNAGYEEILIAFMPQSTPSDPKTWPTWNESKFQENWNLIYNLHDDIVNEATNAGVSVVKFDLYNEGAPSDYDLTAYPQLAEYLERMWNNYVWTFGKSDTVGFSVIGHVSPAERYENMRAIYISTGFGLPYVYDFHIYDNFQTNFAAIDSVLSNYSDSNGLIIGETYYYNSGIDTAINAISTSRTVWHIYQWPLQSTSAPGPLNCAHTDITFPEYYTYDD